MSAVVRARVTWFLATSRILGDVLVAKSSPQPVSFAHRSPQLYRLCGVDLARGAKLCSVSGVSRVNDAFRRICCEASVCLARRR